MILGGGSRSRNRHGISGGPHDIVSITNDGNDSLLFTTAAAHGLLGGSDVVLVSGTSHSAYDALTPVDETPTPTTFVSYEPYDGDSTGGVWLGKHDIVSITDDGGGTARATTAVDNGLMPGDYIQISGSSVSGYNGIWKPINFDGPALITLADPLTGIPVPYTADATGGTWAAVTQYSNGFVGDDTVDTSTWVGTATIEGTGAGADGTTTTGGGGGAYAKVTLTAPFAAMLNAVFSSFGATVDNGVDSILVAAAAGGTAGGAGGDCLGDVVHSGGDGGLNVGGGGGGAGFAGDGGGGGDGDGGTSSAVGGGGGGDGNDGGGYLGDPDDTGSNGNVAGGGGSAGGAGIPGTGATGIVVFTHYELT